MTGAPFVEWVSIEELTKFLKMSIGRVKRLKKVSDPISNHMLANYLDGYADALRDVAEFAEISLSEAVVSLSDIINSDPEGGE